MKKKNIIEFNNGTVVLEDGAGLFLKQLLPYWVQEARFQNTAIDLYRIPEYDMLNRMEREDISNSMFLVAVPKREGWSVYRPETEAKLVASIPCAYGSGLEDDEVVQSLYEEMDKFLGDKELMKKEHERFANHFGKNFYAGQGGGTWPSVKIDFSDFFYRAYLAISCHLKITPA